MINRLFAIAWLVACVVAQAGAQSAAAFPKGDIKGPFVWKSTIYPGTERDYWVYVPYQYNDSKPTCSMIVQDGLSRATGWRLPRVLDSLIDLEQIPVIIGIFIDHGKVPATGVDNWPRYNRSFEYDALGDRYARFLVEEIIPEVEKSYYLSKDPNDRSIAGASSGAICAFNAAWQRPDQFRRVLSTIGTYVGLRGGDEFSTLVRKTEPKPLRVFLEDGSGDLNIYAGDWWAANQAMLSALTWAGYEVNHAWGNEGHNSKGAAKILPEALKWLWKDYPKPVSTPQTQAQRLNPVIAREDWTRIAAALQPRSIAINGKGDVYVATGKEVHKINSNGSTTMLYRSPVSTIAFGPNNVLYGSDDGSNRIVTVNEQGVARTLISDVDALSILASSKGLYFLEGTSHRTIKFFSFATSETTSTGIAAADYLGGLAISADQTFLHASSFPLGFSLKISTDGTLSSSQEYTHYHAFPGLSPISSGPTAMTVDSENRLYTGSKLGIQISDQLGRINYIMSTPESGYIFDIKFGGPDFSTLYLVVNSNLYMRKLSAKGVLPFLPPVKPPKPGL